MARPCLIRITVGYRLSYSQCTQIIVHQFQRAAPGGFSARFADLAHTKPRFAVSEAGLLVPINAFGIGPIMPQKGREGKEAGNGEWRMMNDEG